MPKTKKKQNKSNGANLGFEATMWAAADKLRGWFVFGHICCESHLLLGFSSAKWD